MQDGNAVTAAAFTPDSESIAVASAANEVALFSVALLQHTSWSASNAARLPARLLNMPGRIMHISFCPDPLVSTTPPSAIEWAAMQSRLLGPLDKGLLNKCI